MTLYRLVQERTQTFYAQVECETGPGLPKLVKDQVRDLLECGIPANVFCTDAALAAHTRNSWHVSRINYFVQFDDDYDG